MTGRDLVLACLRLIGVLAPGETLAAQEATDGLSALNRMLSSWSVEGLLIFATTEESPLTLTPGVASVTLGATGDITTRPIKIEKALIRDGSTDYSPMRMLNVDEYAAIPDKSVQSTFPYSFYDDGGYPLRTIKLYPVPSSANQLVLFTSGPLTAIANLDTVLSFPPGYERAFVYNGAIELAPEYARQAPAEVVKVADDSKANIKRQNHRPLYLRCDEAVLPSGGRFDIMTGDYR